MSNKYYIGITTNPEFRLQDHVDSNGSAWTKKYPPVLIHKLYSDCDSWDEDKITLIYMSKYGIENVRGGSFCSIKLSNSDIDTIKKMILSGGNKCYKCGKHGHYARECSMNNTKNYKHSDESDDEDIFCERCGRASHSAESCYAKLDIDGYLLY